MLFKKYFLISQGFKTIRGLTDVNKNALLSIERERERIYKFSMRRLVEKKYKLFTSREKEKKISNVFLVVSSNRK